MDDDNKDVAKASASSTEENNVNVLTELELVNYLNADIEMNEEMNEEINCLSSIYNTDNEPKTVVTENSLNPVLKINEEMANCLSSFSNTDNEPKRKFARRNYRRRDQSQSSDSSVEEPEVVAAIEISAPDSPTENSPSSSNYSRDVSLDDIILNNAINSDNDNEEDDSDSTDSDFSFDSHLSLLHIMGNRRVFEHSSDSDSSVNENVIEDSKTRTR